MRVGTATVRRRLARVVLPPLVAVLVAGFVATTGASTAHAAAYRFWGFYQWQDSAWVLAPTGPASVTPEDGAVEGWRLAVSSESGAPRVPRAAGDFDAICGGTPAEDGKKRVAVVVDYGIAEELPGEAAPPRPRGACAVVEPGASSAQVLASIGEVREQDGLVCGIDGVPATGCGDQVDAPATVPSPEPTVELVLPAARQTTPAATPSDEATGDATGNAPGEGEAAEEEATDGFPFWETVGVAVVLVLLAGGFLVRRRRQASGES